MNIMFKREIFVILDNIRSRENVGSIFRTADAAGVKKIFLCGITPTPPHDKISKTALGAEEYVPWEHHKQTWRLLRQLSKEQFSILALEQTKGSKNIFQGSTLDTLRSNLGNKKIALVVGNEVKGLSPKILNYCDDIVHIPMYGRKESLNVSVALGVAVYQIIHSSTRQF